MRSLLEYPAALPRFPRFLHRFSSELRVVLFIFAAVLLLLSFAYLALPVIDWTAPHARTFLTLRATRAAACLLIGAALASAGVLVQGLFRNPLASPSILGTTAGAKLGGEIALVTAAALSTTAFLPTLLVPVFSLVGAWISLAVLLAFVPRTEDPLPLLLIGFALSCFFVGIGGLVTSIAHESWEVGRALVGFALGSVSGVGIREVAIAAPLVIVGFGVAFAYCPSLDLLLTGEEEAATLGLPLRSLRAWCAVWASMLAAAAVAIGGSLAFVGLVVPHALRPVVGARHASLLPASALAGAVFVLACDFFVRLLPTRSEIPLGVVTDLIGAPFFIALLLRARRLDG